MIIQTKKKRKKGKKRGEPAAGIVRGRILAVCSRGCPRQPEGRKGRRKGGVPGFLLPEARGKEKRKGEEVHPQ